MRKLKPEDFTNAKFAEHPDGGIAMRNALDLDWATSGGYQEYTDQGMFDEGWIPVETTMIGQAAEYRVTYLPAPDAFTSPLYSSLNDATGFVLEQTDRDEWQIEKRYTSRWVVA